MNKQQRLALGATVATLVVAVGLSVLDRRDRPHPYNVLLVTLDTTRADRLGCYGHAAGETPALDRLAAEGVLFENAYCTVPLTLPSHASILTGLLPPEHGIRRNGEGALPRDIPMITDLLYAQDYKAAAFTAIHILGAKYGFDRGFDVYDAPVPPPWPRPGHTHDHQYRIGSEVVDAAIRWLDTVGSGRFFCWVHLFDPHVPYNAHENLFGDRFVDHPYDAEITYADIQVGRLIARLESLGVRDDTLIIVAGDHGESLDEHDEPYPFHGFLLYNSTVRVPLIVSHRSLTAAGSRVDANVSLVDILPTVADWLRVRPLARTSGRSLVAALRGGTIESRPCYAETMTPESYGCSALQGLIADEWKYIRSPEPELYNIENDPGEMRNLATQHPEVRDRMETRLAATEANMVALGTAEKVAMSKNDRRLLESLGYASGAAAPDAVATNNIKDILSAIDLSQEATELQTKGLYDEAIEAWRLVVDQCPECTMFRNSLGTALLNAGHVADACDVFRGLLSDMRIGDLTDPERSDETPGLHVYVINNLAYSLGKLGAYDEAMPLIREALELSPSMAPLHHTLATLYRGIGQLAHAKTTIKVALALDDGNQRYMLLAAELHAESGNLDAARELLGRIGADQLDEERRRRLTSLEERLANLRDDDESAQPR